VQACDTDALVKVFCLTLCDIRQEFILTSGGLHLVLVIADCAGLSPLEQFVITFQKLSKQLPRRLITALDSVKLTPVH
jgi:hypothetical protein